MSLYIYVNMLNTFMKCTYTYFNCYSVSISVLKIFAYWAQYQKSPVKKEDDKNKEFYRIQCKISSTKYS